MYIVFNIPWLALFLALYSIWNREWFVAGMSIWIMICSYIHASTVMKQIDEIRDYIRMNTEKE